LCIGLPSRSRANRLFCPQWQFIYGFAIAWLTPDVSGYNPRSPGPPLQQMTLHNSSEKEKKLLPVYEPSNKDWTHSDLTFVSFSELPPLERLRLIQNLLRTGAGRSSLAAKTQLLEDASISPLITPLPPSESMKKPHFSFSTSNEHVLRANLQTWFFPERKSRLKLPKARARIR
jgi:hypothetical protein